MLSLMDTIVSLIVKVLWKLISLICFRVYLEVNVHKNPTCFSRWSVSISNSVFLTRTKCSNLCKELLEKDYIDLTSYGEYVYDDNCDDDDGSLF